jgi:predicted component of type VI protein secretion system
LRWPETYNHRRVLLLQIQFINLDGVDEPECARVQNILFGQGKFVRVPSRKPILSHSSSAGGGSTQHAPPPLQQQLQQPPPQPPPQQQHQPPPQPQMPTGPPPMVSQAQWDPHRGMGKTTFLCILRPLNNHLV